MCGITGYLNFSDPFQRLGTVEAMTAALEHRGPDASGFFNDGPLTFGHKRLSIIDLSICSNQPLSDHNSRYHIVFNGEIYNYKEIRSLIPDYPYKTNGDTETILAAYSKWGPACLNHFAGMFAFAIWDSTKRELFIARDRLGVKPLYYYWNDQKFLFASEIRSLLSSGHVPRKADFNAIQEFLEFQSFCQPNTIVEGIKSLDAGSYMLIANKNTQTVKYWNITNRKEVTGSYVDVKNEVFRLLTRSVQRRMVSDVPVGAFLSGGIDSSAIVGLMASLTAQPVNTFTIGFDEKDFDETEYAKFIADKFNTKHQVIKLNEKSFIEQMLPALDSMDSPSGDGVNSYVVSKAIRESGITVALSGVGGDELFAGYPIFRQYLTIKRLEKIWPYINWIRNIAQRVILHDVSGKESRYRQLIMNNSLKIDKVYPILRQILSPPLVRQFINAPAINSSSISASLSSSLESIEKFPILSHVSIAEYFGYTRNTLLTDMDQMSMAVSLEVREPFFDHQLIEYVLGIPDKYKYPSYPKKLLVDSLGDLLPLEIVHRKKQGFVFPWKVWMRKELASFCEAKIISICKRDFIKGDALLEYWRRFSKGDDSIRWMELWLFVVLEYWLQKNNVE